MYNCIPYRTSRGGATIGAGGGHAPHLFQILVFLLYWTPTFQCIGPRTFKFVAPPLHTTTKLRIQYGLCTLSRTVAKSGVAPALPRHAILAGCAYLVWPGIKHLTEIKYTSRIIPAYRHIISKLFTYSSGTSFQFFPGGGNILTYFLKGGGQNMKKTKFCKQKHKKVTIFQIKGGG